jgi:hypothetical protein
VLSGATSLRWLGWVAFLPAMVGMAGMPVAVGIAILGYRHYEIDFLINRTLVYGSLSALLVTVYVGTIVVLQGLLRALTGQESQRGIVASTLVVAALFNPLRRLIQSFIDRGASTATSTTPERPSKPSLWQAQGRDGPKRLERRSGGGW